MPETALERHQARQAERDALIEQFTAEAKARAIAFGKSPDCQDEQHDDCLGVTTREGFPDCLCTCHDPVTTYWLEWGNFRTGLDVAGRCSGPYGTAEEAIVDGFAESDGDARWIRAHSYVEQVTKERWDALEGWDEKTEDEKAALRPSIPGEST